MRRTYMGRKAKYTKRDGTTVEGTIQKSNVNIPGTVTLKVKYNNYGKFEFYTVPLDQLDYA